MSNSAGTDSFMSSQVKLSERLEEVQDSFTDETKTQILSIIKGYEKLTHENDFGFMDKNENAVKIYTYDDEKLRYVYSHEILIDKEKVTLEYASYVRDGIHLLGGTVRGEENCRLWTQVSPRPTLSVRTPLEGLSNPSQNIIVEGDRFRFNGIKIFMGNDKILLSDFANEVTVFELDSSGKLLSNYKIKDMCDVNGVVDKMKDIYVSLNPKTGLLIWKMLKRETDSTEYTQIQQLSSFSNPVFGKISVIGKTISFREYITVNGNPKVVTSIGRINEDYKIKTIHNYAFYLRLLSEFVISYSPKPDDIDIVKFDEDGKEISKTSISVDPTIYHNIIGISNKTVIIGGGHEKFSLSEFLDVYRDPQLGCPLGLTDYRKTQSIVKDGEYGLPYSTEVGKERIEKTSKLLGEYLNVSTSLLNIVSKYI